MSLDFHSTIKKLENYSDSPAPILSVYLEIPESQNNINQKLRKLFQDLVSLSLDPNEQELFANDLDSIEGYLQKYSYRPEERGLAFFTGGNNLWEVIHTNGPATTSLVIKHSPNLNPLLEEEKNNYSYLFVLVDREKAKFLNLSDGVITDEMDVKDKTVPQKIHTGTAGSKQNKVDRQFQKYLDRHLETISKKLETFTQGKKINSVIVGGHKTLIHQIEKHLPRSLQNKILGEFITELDISNNEIIGHAERLLEKYHIPVKIHNHANLMNP